MVPNAALAELFENFVVGYSFADHHLVLVYRHQPLQFFIKILDDKYLLSLLINMEVLKHNESLAIRMDIEPPKS